MEFGVGYYIFAIAWSLVWGFATAGVRERKGYGRRWFWFGFFLGLIPFIIACAIPEKKDDFESDTPGERNWSLATNGGSNSVGGWQCSCGRAHPAYVSTCTCGLNKRENALSAMDDTAKV